MSSERPIKPTLLDLRERHHFDIKKLAEQAGVHELVVLSMLRGTPVYPAQAVRVLRALSHLTGVRYGFETVHVRLIDSGEGTDAQ